MRVSVIPAVVAALVGCGERAQPTAPAVTGTLLCTPHPRLLGATATLPDEMTELLQLQQQVIDRVTNQAFLHRVAVAERLDEPELARAISARMVKDSRAVEIGVALPDAALATRACDAIVDYYLAEQLDAQRDDVRVLDRCAPARPHR